MKLYRSKRVFYIFCFLFIFLTAAVPFGAAQDGEKKDVYLSINFNDVDISEFIKFISEFTGKTFVVDKRVKGKVTILSPQSKISVSEAYKVFESVLEVHGYTTVESGEIIKIIPSPDARSKNIEILLRDQARSPEDKVVTQLIPLRYADANDIKRLFAPMASKSSLILSYTPTNMVIMTDVYSNIKRLMRIIKIIDVPGTGQEISVISMENADATKMVRLLITVFQAGRKKSKSLISSVPRFVADERTNTIVLLASKDESLKIKKLIKRLDGELPKDNQRIRVYYLENATAEDLAKTLQSLSSKQSTSKTKGKKTSPVVSESVKITADKATNSLIIMAEKEEYQIIENIIKKLDIARSMVYIECLIMEVNVTKGFSLGTEWIAGGKASYGSDKDAWVGSGWSGGGDTAFSNLSGVASAAATSGAVLMPQGFSLGVFGETIEIGGVSFQNVGAVAQAFKKDQGTHILSTPQLLTTDNEEATITVGKNVPYQTKTGTTSSSETYNTYEYKDVGISLKITPQISKDRLVRLTIEQEVTKLDSTANTGTDERPTTFKRTVNTTVIVNDGNTIVIGGLIDDSFSETENRIPCLGDIPGLGWLFKSLSRGREKTDLYIFLTPHVLKSAEEASKFYKEKKEEIDKVEQENIKLYKTPPEKPYELPALPELME